MMRARGPPGMAWRGHDSARCPSSRLYSPVVATGERVIDRLSRQQATMSRAFTSLAFALTFAMTLASPCESYSARAGSCEHAGVGHDGREKLHGDGGYVLRLGAPGTNVPGATVAVELLGARKFKGFLIRPMSTTTNEAIGSFGSAMPIGSARHGECERFATHTSWHSRGATSTVMPWIVPKFAKGEGVRFEVTVVESYSKWYAFEATFESGTRASAGDESVKYDDERAPTGEREMRAPDGSKVGTVRDVREVTTAGRGRKVERASDADARDAALRDARVVHGAIMALAWLVLSPGASLLARYGRRFDAWWFKSHLNAQCAAVALTALSSYFIIHVRGWEKAWGAHGKYGMIVLAFGALQLYAGFNRKSIPRPTFKLWHRAFGVGTGALAAYNCTIGAGMVSRMNAPHASIFVANSPMLVKLCICVVIGAGAAMERQRRVAFGRLKSTKSMV